MNSRKTIKIIFALLIFSAISFGSVLFNRFLVWHNIVKKIMGNILTKKILFLLILSFQSIAGVFIKVPIEELIKSSEIIIEGKVIKKSSKSETMSKEVQIFNNNSKTIKKIEARTPFTTFVVSIRDLLYGKYEKETIEIKVEGGCGDDGMCLYDSANYDYEIGDKIVIFLSYDKVNNHYYSSDAAVTAFKLNELNILTRTGEVSFLNKNTFIVEKQTQKKQISLDSLKRSILEISSNE